MRWQTLAPVLLDALASSSHAPLVSMGVTRVGDPDATRTVYATIVVLAILGVVLAGLAYWVFRRTRPEPELLAPLETMQTRGWRKLDPAAQRRSLDESRPTAAAPLRREASAPAVDSSFATIAPVASFDDLADTDADRDADDVAEPDVGASAVFVDGPTEDHVRPDVDVDVTTEPEPPSAQPNDPDDTAEIPGDGQFGLDDDDDDDHGARLVRSTDPLLTPNQPSSDCSN